MPDLAASLSAFGADVTSKTASGLGEPEEHLRAPLETLLADVAAQLKLTLVLAGEEHLADLRVRPDYAVMVGGALTGHIEVKAPGKGADPSRFRGHDRDQWSRLRSLPNVLYTDGEHWAVYRYGEPTDGRARLSGPADQVGSSLGSSTGSLLALLADFLQWQPVPPRSVKDLALQAAQLCALLRAEVRELLATEPALQAVAGEWRDLLFPDASDDQFADGYAQTVTFALLLGRVDGVDFSGGDLGAIAGHVADRHTLIGTALGILANPQLTKRFAVSLPTLVRVMAVVEWDELAKGREDRWLLFYEDFLQAYDPALRRATGSYYTPNRVVSAMTRMVDDLLRDHSRFGLGLGLADDGVRLVDPAAGSGTFLLEVFRRMADTIEADEGDAQLPARLGAALERVVGFENLIGPYAVAELRLTAELTRRGVDVGDRLRLYVADTLDDPAAAQKKMGLMYEPIARSRRAANRVKADEPVLVVLGNPPYKERSRGEGGWIEDGDEAAVEAAPLRAFFGREAPEAARAADRLIGAGPHLKHLYNLYVYFWRWATWKVFDRHEHQPNGVIAFITAAGFVQGPGFAFMRRYLRRQADDVWVIDCSPEGHQPPVSTRVFGGVQQPVCITIVSRTGRTSADQPAHVRYRTISGSQGQKFDALDAIDLRAADGWQDAADSWTAPFLPAATGGWATYAPLEELLGWSGSGTMPGRTWVVAPDRETLRRRWQRLVTAPTSEVKRELFQEHRTDRRIDLTISGELPGLPHPDRAVESEGGGRTPRPRSASAIARSIGSGCSPTSGSSTGRTRPCGGCAGRGRCTRRRHTICLTGPERPSPAPVSSRISTITTAAVGERGRSGAIATARSRTSPPASSTR